jgi:hypothetical protein
MFDYNNPEFVIALIIVFAYFWVFCPKTVIWKTKWWKRHVSGTCTYPGECFECNKGNCEGCPVLNHGK